MSLESEAQARQERADRDEGARLAIKAIVDEETAQLREALRVACAEIKVSRQWIERGEEQHVAAMDATDANPTLSRMLKETT